jgi:hypothetical protein
VDPDPVDPEEENWAWNKTVLERFTVKGVDVLGVGSFSVVRKGVDLSTGRAVAVKALKARDNVKFRREVFLFDALFMPEEADSKGVRAIERSPTVLLGQQEYRKCKNPLHLPILKIYLYSFLRTRNWAPRMMMHGAYWSLAISLYMI